MSKEFDTPPTTFQTTDSGERVPKYTIPIIHDSKTGKLISDSSKIAAYLDETYPDTPAVIPNGTYTLQRIFQTSAVEAVMPVIKLTPAFMIKFMAEEVRKSTPPFPEPSPEEIKAAFEESQGKFNKFSQSSSAGAGASGFEFVMGGKEKPTFADFTVVAFVYPWKFIWGEESEEWRGVKTWADGFVGWEVEKVVKLLGL
ncbi:hypothetical protein V5O48_012871 [Marasmius crinis-equi]|uniref:Glutathione S-transferase UstS-like C-terminal domain-containing protein n=1 Tax=Marasmius crinis-equi TaxID=585013 RepID=A0ABR3F254_9AGAR